MHLENKRRKKIVKNGIENKNKRFNSKKEKLTSKIEKRGKLLISSKGLEN